MTRVSRCAELLCVGACIVRVCFYHMLPRTKNRPCKDFLRTQVEKHREKMQKAKEEAALRMVRAAAPGLGPTVGRTCVLRSLAVEGQQLLREAAGNVRVTKTQRCRQCMLQSSPGPRVYSC